MNISVIGMGGVGGYFGTRFARLLETEKDLHITFIARGEHLRQIRENGLFLDADDGTMHCRPSLATDMIEEMPVPDLCLVCVKEFDLGSAMERLRGRVSDRTVILPLLNGADIYERIRGVIKTGVVLPACVYIGTHIESPGMIKQRGGTCTIHFGKDPHNDYMDSRIFGLFDMAGIKYSWMDDPWPEIWGKYIFIAAYGLVTAYSGKSIGQILESPELSGHVRSIINEVVAIARARNVRLPESIAEDSFRKGEKFPYETGTSFQRDYAVKDKPDERDLFGGTVIRMGRELGIPTPATGFILGELESAKSMTR